MKKILSLLSALAIICTIPMINIIDVNALEAATMEEYNTQIKEKDEFPNPDEKYTEITENNLVYHLYNEYAVLYDGAFTACINLKNIEFPESITSVSGGICYSCVSLSNVVFKGEIEKIGYNAKIL